MQFESFELSKALCMDYDLFVIGAGSGGVRAARMAAATGARVAIAENRYLGGTCVNVGCVPKKLFVYGSHFAEEVHDAAGFGWSAAPPEFSWTRLRNNKTAEIQRLNGIYGNLLDGAGVTTFWGRARLLDAHRIAIAGREVTAERILVATGSWPTVPHFPGSELAITSNEAFYLSDFPQTAVVVGGGYIGVEFAGIFHGFGAQTHLLYRRELFLRGFDVGIREFVRDEITKKGIDLRFSTNVRAIEMHGPRKRVTLNDGSTLDADVVLYATGRAPKSEGLGLEALGIELAPNGAIRVDDDFRTSVDNIFALGDVIDRAQLTPVAIKEAMSFVAKHFTSNPGANLDYDTIPTAVFCQPNIGTVGLTEDAAAASGAVIDVFESTFRPMKHTMTGSDERSYMKLLVRRDDDRVVGVHMVGPDAGEIIQGLAVALVARLTKAQFDATVPIHPTSAEEFVTMRESSRVLNAA